MKKIIFSTVTLLLVLQGCNNSSSKNKDSGTTEKVSEEIKSFASTFKDANSVGGSVSKGSSSVLNSEQSNTEAQKQRLESCEDGGTRKIITDFNFDTSSQTEIMEMLTNGISYTVDSDNCVEDGEKVNASMTMEMKLNSDLMTMNLKFNNDSTFEDLETTEVLTITKNSSMNIKELSDTEEVVTENIKFSSSKGESYETIGLVSHEIDNDATELSYDVSGKRINNSSTYSVDEKYDASKTPMTITSENGDLVSGTSKYYNEKNEHITIKVIEKNRIKVSVDNNNDGKDDATETIDL